LFGKAFELTRSKYVERPDDRKLVQSAINGMLMGLDPHSAYLDANAYRELEAQTRGEFGGVGIELTIRDGRLKVIAPIDGTPAAKAGILSGDLVTEVDGRRTKGLALDEAVKRMRGPIGTKVRLEIVRQGAERPIDVVLVREIIQVHAVSYRPEGDDIGYIRISLFNEHAVGELQHAIADLRSVIGEDKLRGYILDLRNNPGGLFDEAVGVANAFLARGEIVTTRGRNAEDSEHYAAASIAGDFAMGKPLIALVNGGSASASEIVAGALQDHRRASIVGTRSFGKGSVQSIISLGAGNGALRLTTARYFTPSGRSIQAQGIVPDIEVMQDIPTDVNAARVVTSEAALEGHLKVVEGAEEHGSQSYVPSDPKDDKALQMADNLLRGTGPKFPASARRISEN
jgi:carboxyl-terminal processing protease